METKTNYWKVASILLMIFLAIFFICDFYNSSQQVYDIEGFKISKDNFDTLRELGSLKGWSNFTIIDIETGKSILLTRVK